MKRLSEKIWIGAVLLIFAGVLAIAFIFFSRAEAVQTSQMSIQFILLVIITVLIFTIGLMFARYFLIKKKQRTETDYLAKLISNVQDAILSTDDQFVIKSWNKGAEMIYEWTAEEAIGQKLEYLLPTAYGEHTVEEVRADFTKQGYFNQELIRKTRSGKHIHVLVSSSALYDEKGKFSGLVAVNKNITERKQLEEQLLFANQALEKKISITALELNNVFERITDAFLALDNNWCYTYMNKKAGELNNMDPASMIGKCVWDYFEADGDPTEHDFYKAVHKAMNEQVDVHTEVYYAPYGVWFENHIYPSPEGLSLFFRDITDKKIAQQSIHDSEEKRRLIMNSALDAIICIEPDDKITFWNPMAEKIFGWKAAEVQGHLLSEIIIPKQFRERHANGMSMYRKTGQGPALNVLLEFSAIDREGKEFPVELTILPIKQGSEEFFCAFIRDISARKRTEETIKNSELRFRSLIEKGNEIIAMHDREGKVVYMSPSIEKLLGYKAEERVGKHALEFVHKDDIPRIKKILENLVTRPGETAQAQWRHQHADGNWHWMEGVATNLLHDPAVRAVVHNFRDISEREKIETELIEKNTELQKLSAYLQHVREEERKYIAREVHDELGQLVSALKINIDWINLKIPGLDELAKKRIDHTTKTIEVLISSIRKIASSLRPSILDDFGLNAAVEWQCREIKNINGIQCIFNSDFNDNHLSIEIKTELFRITQESLTNVMRHSGAENVTVEITEDEETIHLKIIDDGVGFDTTVMKNTLGLIGLRERAVSLNGSLRIESEIGKGTIVLATIPKNTIQ
ncbi:MAG: PAS domain S-box protein [Bacteroidota bacterium]